MFCLIYNLNMPKANAVRYQRTEKFIMVACYVNYSGVSFGMAQYSANYITVTLSPSPAILLYFPGVDDVTHQVHGVAGVVFEKII
jgi:NADH:ubiquinone oxidoreductase subunit H